MVWEFIYLCVGILFTLYLEKTLYDNTGTFFGVMKRFELIVLWPVGVWTLIVCWINYFLEEQPDEDDQF